MQLNWDLYSWNQFVISFFIGVSIYLGSCNWLLLCEYFPHLQSILFLPDLKYNYLNKMWSGLSVDLYYDQQCKHIHLILTTISFKVHEFIFRLFIP